MADRIRKLSKWRIALFVSVIGVILCVTVILAAAAISTYTVTIVLDGVETPVDTRSTEPLKILEQAGLALEENDWLDTSGYIEGEPCVLYLYRACSITIQDDKLEPMQTVQSGTVARALENKGITLTPEDIVEPTLDTPLAQGMEIVITRAFNVTVQADGATKGVRLTGGTVTEALEAAGITYGADDEFSHGLNEDLEGITQITVYRVNYEYRTKTEVIAYKSETKKTKDLFTGERKVSQKGKDGQKEVVYKDKYVDGKKVKTTVDSEKVIKAAVNKITLVGTASVNISKVLKKGLTPISELAVPSSVKLDEKGLPTNYKYFVDGTAKAYSGDTATASGRKPMPGHIAVDPKQFPYGTQLYIVSLDGNYIYGYSIAADTGGFVKTKGCTIDLFMNSRQQCYAWGHRGVRIYVL